MFEVFQYGFMLRALLAALLVGAAAPMVGIFLMQRRLSLIGDGIGHVALAGVAVGALTHTAPVFMALVAAIAAAVIIEVLRTRNGTSGDVALAVLFYGGIGTGVVLLSLTPAGTANMQSFLFGSIMTTSPADILTFMVLAAVVMGSMWILRPRLFAVANDEEYAKAAGLKVLNYNVLLSVLTASTVVLSMRVVGLLLISALMIVPNATAQQIARTFATSMAMAMGFGMVSAVGGVWTSYYANTPSGGTIVVFAIVMFLAVALVRSAPVTRLLAKYGITMKTHASRGMLAGEH